MIDSLISKWELSNLQCILKTQDRGVYIVDSRQYGECILKIDLNNHLRNEYNYLKSFNSKYVCRVYNYDERGAILIERICPGTSLRNENAPDKRLTVYHQLSMELHKYCDNQYESYLDWFNKLENYFTLNNLDSSFQDHLLNAIDICKEMFSKYDTITLHGDLHHDNILLNCNGEYTAIDAKGVSGPAILELGRFILNEMMMVKYEDCEEHICDVIIHMEALFNYKIVDISKVFYMEVVLANAWNIEDGIAINEQQMVIAEKILRWSMNYV